MVAYAELEIKEKELKQALELADSLDERKALRLELREVRKLLFDTPKNSANDISKTSSKPSTTSTIIQTKKQTTTDFNNNNNDMTLTSQDSYDAPSVSKTAAERAARRTRRAQHMKNMVNDTSAITTVINATSQDKKPEEKHVEENMGQLKTETKNENSVGSVQKVSTELSTKPTFHVRDNTKSQTQNTPTFSVRDNTGGNVQSKPTFNANSSPGLRRTATWSPKDRVASKNATNNNAFSSNKAKFGSQETSVNNNRLSLQDRTPNRFQNSRDKSPSRFEQNRDKSPSRFEANRNRPGNSLSIREKSPTPFGDRTQPERPKSHIGVAGMKGISGSAANRMSMFKEAEEKQAREIELKKKRDEDRKKNAEVIAAKAAEDAKKRAEEEARKKAEDERKKKEEEERKKKEAEEEAKKASESNKEEMKDSEKMKYAAPCMRKREKKKVVRRTMSISSIVLDWVQEMIKDYPVEVTNFSSSWNNGMAFCALIHKFNPDEFDFNELKPENKRHNFDLAFNTGLKCKNIPILLDTEDMVRMKKPEPRSVQCYIQWIWSVYGPTSGYGPTPQEIQTASLS